MNYIQYNIHMTNQELQLLLIILLHSQLNSLLALCFILFHSIVGRKLAKIQMLNLECELKPIVTWDSENCSNLSRESIIVK